MFSDELVKFLKDNFPVQLSEIDAAMDLLVESLDEASEIVALGSHKLSLSKEYKNAAELMMKAEELHRVSKTIEGYASTLQTEDVAPVSEDEVLEDIEKKMPDYSKYEVDNTVVHTLHENYVYKRPHAFELRGRKVHATEWKRVLVETCNILAEIDPGPISGFPNNPRFNGKKSQYFKTGDAGLMRSPPKT